MSESNDELTVLPTLMAYRDTAAYGFVPPAFGALKEAGMRRRRRNRIVVVGACVAVLGLSAAVAVNAMPMRGTQPPIGESASPTPSIPPSVPPSAPPSTPPSTPPTSRPPSTGRIEIPKTAMLQPEDLGPGYKADDKPEYAGDGDLFAYSIWCTQYQHKAYSGSEPKRSGSAIRQLDSGSSHIQQRMSLSSVEQQRWEMETVRKFVRACESFSIEGSREERLTIVAQGFAGEESLLIRDKRGYGWVFVRQGEMFSQLEIGSSRTDDQAKELARKAAQRMCAFLEEC